MSIDPSSIHLTPEQQAYVAREAERTGMPWSRLLEQFVPVNERAGNSAESALDVAKRLGLVGICDGDAPDLATNPTHMEGFGDHGNGANPG